MVALVSHAPCAGATQGMSALERPRLSALAQARVAHGAFLPVGWRKLRVLTLRHRCCAARRTEALRTLPEGMSEDAKLSYVAIATRSRNDALFQYSVLALGAEQFVTGQSLKRKGARVDKIEDLL